ncbi:MAG TPA: helix-turn-helix transcriptional regulator [Bdellovibrio sp.]|uniref:helix-turn-helix domain-containing protein n=1 Tax=Bdellovibrio sp. TaxID=28201 RepID=UPI002F0FECC7
MGNLKLDVVLKQLIAEKGVTLRSLSKQTKVPQSSLSSFLAGAGTSKPEHVRSLAKFFNVSMEYLLFGEDEKPPSLEEVLTEDVFSGWLKVEIKRAIPNKRKSER